MLIVGLTGSIAMGKSETARMFRALDIPVFDADAVVHKLYERGGAAVDLIAKRFPDAVKGGSVDRETLTRLLFEKPEGMKALEAIVHPLVREEERRFLERCDKAGAPFVILDIPLLFETGGIDRVDRVIVVSAPADLQRKRALLRPGMTSGKFEAILKKQVPDAEKRAQADYIVDSSGGLDHAFDQVRRITEELTREAIRSAGNA